MSTIYDFLQLHRAKRAPYIIDGNNSYSYADVNAQVDRDLLVLKGIGIEIQNVAILSPTSIDYVYNYWAIVSARCTVVPLNPKLTTTELTAEIIYCDCNWMIYSRSCEVVALDMHHRTGVGLIARTKAGDLMVIAQPTLSQRTRACDSDVAVMLHTSGTTANPKKVMLTHRNLEHNTIAHTASLGLKASDDVLIVLPMYFGYCNTSQFLCHTRLGSKIVLYQSPVFMAKSFCDTIERYSVCTTTIVPTMLRILDQYPYLGGERLRTLRYLCFGGGHASLEVIKRVIKRLPNTRLVQTYGQTECSPRITTMVYNGRSESLASVGKAIPNVSVAIMDNMGNPLQPKIEGEICVRGQNVMPGYYKRPEESAAVLRNGWLRTGDLGYLDQDGFLYVVGRVRNVINSGGMKIYPEEVEAVLAAHPLIEDVRIRGEPHVEMGEIVIAEVVVAKGTVFLIDDAFIHLEGKLASYKWPRRINILEALPKTYNGKTRRC